MYIVVNLSFLAVTVYQKYFVFLSELTFSLLGHLANNVDPHLSEAG